MEPIESVEKKLSNEKVQHAQQNIPDAKQEPLLLIKTEKKLSKNIITEKLQSQLPKSLFLGAPINKGMNFIDAMSQVLKQYKFENNLDAKDLRKKCDEYIKSDKHPWVKHEMLRLGKNSELSYTLNAGCPQIEGRILSELYKIKLHVLNVLAKDDDKLEINEDLYDTNEVVSNKKLISDDYSNKEILHLIQYNNHFIPLLSYLDKSEKLDSTDNNVDSDSNNIKSTEESATERYTPIANKEYDSRNIDTVIKASFNRYDIQHQDSSYFLFKSSHIQNITQIIAIADAIALGTRFSCIGDYFKSKYRPARTHSPSTRPINEESSDSFTLLWDECEAYFEKTEVNIKILLPFMTHASSWVIGEIDICKKNNNYNLYFSVHDPLGNYTLPQAEFRELKAVFMSKIKKNNDTAVIQEVNIKSSPIKRLLHFDDVASTSVVCVEILLSRVIGRYYDIVQELGTIKLRQLHIDTVIKKYPKEYIRYTCFIEKQARQELVKEKDKQKHKKEEITYTSEYEPVFTKEQIKHFSECQTPQIWKRNAHAAFYAAKNNHAVLLEALLGVEYNNDLDLQEEQEFKRMYGHYEDYYIEEYKCLIAGEQIKAVKTYLEKPEHLQRPTDLYKELELISQKNAKDLKEALEVWLSAREKPYFNGKIVKIKKLPLGEKSKLLDEFEQKVLENKTFLQIDFEKLKIDLKTAVSRLETVQKGARRQADHIRKDIIEDGNMNWDLLRQKKARAIERHISNIVRLIKRSKGQLPDYFSQDEYGIWENLYAAKVPINIRDDNFNTLLHIAFKKEHTGIVQLLLARGANIDATNNEGFTPSQEANEDKNNLIVWQQRAQKLKDEKNPRNVQSGFIKDISKVIAKYQPHLNQEMSDLQNSFFLFRLFYDLGRLEQRQAIVNTIKELVEVCETKQNDTELFAYMKDLIVEHTQSKNLIWYRDRGLLNRSKLFEALMKIQQIVEAHKDDYNYIRLAENAKYYLLEQRMIEAEKKAKETAEKMEKQNKNYEEQIKKAEKERTDLEKNHKKAIEDLLAKHQAEWSKYKKEQEEENKKQQEENNKKHQAEREAAEKKRSEEYTALSDKLTKEHSQNMDNLRKEFMTMFEQYKKGSSKESSDQNDKTEDKSDRKDPRPSSPRLFSKP